MFKFVEVYNKIICVGGVGKLFYQEGFPIAMTVEEFSNKGIEISFLHLVNELWDNGWGWKTIESKLKGELQDDINNQLSGLDLELLKQFYDNLEQPRRANGGYEASREMYFQYLYSVPSQDVIKGHHPSIFKTIIAILIIILILLLLWYIVVLIGIPTSVFWAVIGVLVLLLIFAE